MVQMKKGHLGSASLREKRSRGLSWERLGQDDIELIPPYRFLSLPGVPIGYIVGIIYLLIEF